MSKYPATCLPNICGETFLVGVISVNVTLKLLYCRFGGDDYYYYYCSDHDDVDGEKGGGLESEIGLG